MGTPTLGKEVFFSTNSLFEVLEKSGQFHHDAFLLLHCLTGEEALPIELLPLHP